MQYPHPHPGVCELFGGIRGIRRVSWYSISDVFVEVGAVVTVATVLVVVGVNKVIELSIGQLSIWKEVLVVDAAPNQMGVSSTEASEVGRVWILTS